METSREKREEEENFERAYRRIVVDGMFKEKQKEKNQLEDMLEISEIRDYNCLMKYEYILKLGFFSSNVNVLHVYRLVKEEYEKKFEDVAKCLGSTILISIVDTNDINDTCEHMEEYFLKNYEKLKQYSYVIGNTNYPLGFEKNRNGIFRVYLFKIIPNKTFLLNKGNFLYFDNKDIPTNYDSIAIERGLYYETKGLEKIDGIVEEKKKKLYLPNGNYNSCGENINYRSGISNSRNSLHYSYMYKKKHQLLTEFLNRKINVDNTLLKFIPQWVFQKIHIHSNIFIYEDNFYKLNLSPNKCILFHNSKSDKTLHDNDNTLENNENKLKSMYNFNSAFNGGYRHFSMFDDDKCEVRQEDETHVAFSRIEQKGENLTPGEPSIDEEGKIGELCDVDMLDVKKMVHLKGDCSSVYELTKDKIMNCNLLYRIFRNEHGLDKHSEGMALKKSYMYRELWKNLVNYKYINVIHILKVRHSFNSLELVAAFLTISLHYDGLEDFVKHIIKHEIYTLLNKNIDYHTKMKVTQLMDNITTLLCIQRFRMSPLVDKYVQMCFLEVEKNKDSFLSDVQHICEEEGAHLYESYLAQRKNRCSEEAYTCPPDAAFSGVTPNKGVADGGNANGGSSSGGNANGGSSSGGNANGDSSSGVNANGGSSSGGNANGSKSEPPVGEDGRRGEQKRESNILEVNCTVQEEDNTILDNVANAVWRNQPVEKDDLWSSSSANNRISDGEKEELAILKKLKEYIYIYVEKLIKDLVNTHHKDLNDNIRFLFYTIHDEIDGINRTVSMNGKKFSIHTLTLCLDLFLNSILYPYIFYVHEEHVQAGVGGNSALRQKVTLLFGQTLREISIYVFQIYNMGMYDSNLKAFISNIKSNKMLAGRVTNDNMFFLDVSHKLFNWMVKNLEAPRYYAPVKWSYHENVEKSYEKVIKEILSINEYAMANCTNENVDYNILFSTTNFRDILSLCNSVTNDA
ncbi:conserved Plasmodium protein, unknown function [Plasmodium ovale wallikeri]|uniref:Uncharacterized protein n=1 Tax=Plasmodium ovale wallikeri TaxID=864142 RepID=A0A1A8ZI90_PLAOA|nr:conserved Plasmodium protein, unknown function [Plasmodium ovale wallikeri]